MGYDRAQELIGGSDRKGRRAARKAAEKNLFNQAKSLVVKSKRKGMPPPTVGELMKDLDKPQFHKMCESIGLKPVDIENILLSAGAVKGGAEMAEKRAEAKAPTKPKFFRKVDWCGPEYRATAMRLLWGLGVPGLLVLIAMGSVQAFGHEQYTARLGLAFAFLMGTMAGGIGVLMWANQRMREAMRKAKSEEE